MTGNGFKKTILSFRNLVLSSTTIIWQFISLSFSFLRSHHIHIIHFLSLLLFFHILYGLFSYIYIYICVLFTFFQSSIHPSPHYLSYAFFSLLVCVCQHLTFGVFFPFLKDFLLIRYFIFPYIWSGGGCWIGQYVCVWFGYYLNYLCMLCAFIYHIQIDKPNFYVRMITFCFGTKKIKIEVVFFIS